MLPLKASLNKFQFGVKKILNHYGIQIDPPQLGFGVVSLTPPPKNICRPDFFCCIIVIFSFFDAVTPYRESEQETSLVQPIWFICRD